MFCQNCGKKISKVGEFCGFCGRKLKKQTIVTEEFNADKPKKDTKYSGFWIRLGAYFIDFIGVIILAILIMIIEALFGFDDIITKIGILGDYVIWAIYSTFFLSIWSSTPGKMLYGLKVVKENGEKLDFNTSWKRACLQPTSFLLFGAGYWHMGKNEKQQASHDKWLHTVVMGEPKTNYLIQGILSVLGILLYTYLRSLIVNQ